MRRVAKRARETRAREDHACERARMNPKLACKTAEAGWRMGSSAAGLPIISSLASSIARADRTMFFVTRSVAIVGSRVAARSIAANASHAILTERARSDSRWT